MNKLTLNNYDKNEIRNIESNNIKIAKNVDDILKFVNDVKNERCAIKKLYIGKINDNISKLINEKFNIYIYNYNISLNKSSIEHCLNHHSLKEEILRGQIPIKKEDFIHIPIILNYPDKIMRGYDTKQKKSSLIFIKTFKYDTTIVVYVSSKHHNLELQTMYKKINSVTAVNDKNL